MDKLFNIIKTGSESEIIAELNNMNSFEEATLKKLLEKSPNEKISDIIRTVYKEKEANLNIKTKSIQKFAFENSKHNKALEMLLQCFSNSIKSINIDKATSISFEIVKFIIKESSENFPKIVRSKCHNLKENEKLAVEVYNEKISPEEFVKMSLEEMQSEDMKSKDKEYIKDSLLSSQMATATADTDIFICGKCKQRKCTYVQLQTRSCDEPMTTFVTCTVCGNRWKF